MYMSLPPLAIASAAISIALAILSAALSIASLTRRFSAFIICAISKTTKELLTERRNQFNGSNAGQIKTRQDLADIYSAPEAAGEACKTLLLRLKDALDGLEIPFEITGYFEAPTAFLSSATKFSRMDRINTAISQTEALQRLLRQLQPQLSE